MKTYKEAGVDIDAGNIFVKGLKPLADKVKRPGTVSGIGGFGAVFDIKAEGFKDPLLVAATDGVGTKLEIAIAVGKHNTIGIDLVAMCVNDLVCSGAEPLFFLDYFATGKLKKTVAFDVVGGIAEGCKIANCELIGGETAEMPGFYTEEKYDVAGFAMGAVERENLITGEKIQAGDVLLGLRSNGLHSNGFSLVRDIVKTFLLDYHEPCKFDGRSLGEALLTPTRIYSQSCLKVLKSKIGSEIKGLAHITGGGFENISRILPEGLTYKLGTWPMAPVFHWIHENVSQEEMRKTFNCGIGMVVVVPPFPKDNQFVKEFLMVGETPFVIGNVIHEV